MSNDFKELEDFKNSLQQDLPSDIELYGVGKNGDLFFLHISKLSDTVTEILDNYFDAWSSTIIDDEETGYRPAVKVRELK